MKEVYFYGRNSTNHQPMSKSQQLLECQRYALANDYTISEKMFYDDGNTGTNTNRPQWIALMNLVEEKKNITVLTYATDRISRSVKDAILIDEFFERNNCKLISVTQPMLNENSSSAILTRNIGYSVSQYHADVTRELVIRSLSQKAERCEFTGGFPAYGYKVVNNKFEIEENEAKAIRIMFEMVASNCNYNELASALEERGYRKRNGQLFTNRTCFYDYISSQRYKGVYVWGRTKKSKTSGNYNYHQSRPVEEQVIIPNGMPQIVSEALWNKANQVLKERKHKGGEFSAKNTYLLTSRIKCACGRKMYGNARYSGNKSQSKTNSKYVSYRCASKDKLISEPCTHSKEIARNDIDRYVLNQLYWFLKKENSLELIEKVLNEVREEFGGKEEKVVKEMKMNLNRMELQINNLVNVLSVGGGLEVESIISKLKNLEEEKTSLQLKIQELEMKQKDVPSFTREEIILLLDEAYKVMLLDNEGASKAVIRKFITQVTVDIDKVQIDYDLDFLMLGLSKLCRITSVVLRTELKKTTRESYFHVFAKNTED